MKFVFALSLLLANQGNAQTALDRNAIQRIVDDETAAWNKGDAVSYSRHFAAAVTFTNVRGEFTTGRAVFLEKHQVIFNGIFKNTTAKQDIVSLIFPNPNVAVVETLTSISGMERTSPGTSPDAKGRLRTRLLQVVVRQGGVWKVVAYHNVDVKPGVVVPEPH